MDTQNVLNLIDSDVLIEVQRATPEAVAWLNAFDGDLALPAPVAWELLAGSRNAAELRRSQRFLYTFAIEELDARDSARTHELILAHTLSTGMSLPDFLIAAQALNRSATLLSFNLRHFDVIPGLTVRSPYER